MKDIGELEDGDERKEHEDYDDQDQFESALRISGRNVWVEGGYQKDFVTRKLIKYFGAFVVRNEQDESEGVDNLFKNALVYEKAPNASLNVLRARL
jgi:hypothetical protein